MQMIRYGEIGSWGRRHETEQDVWRTELLILTCTLVQQSRCINWTNYDANKTEYTVINTSDLRIDEYANRRKHAFKTDGKCAWATRFGDI
jgi:hypothetical protein